jgi:hypothetical protein
LFNYFDLFIFIYIYLFILLLATHLVASVQTTVGLQLQVTLLQGLSYGSG